MCSGPDCGQIWGQKRFLTKGGRCLPVPAGKRFMVLGTAWVVFLAVRAVAYLPSSPECLLPFAPPLDKVVIGIQLEHCVDAPTLIEVPNFFRILLNRFQNRVAGPGFLVPPERSIYSPAGASARGRRCTP